jgi:hypothetical protein
MALAGAVGLTLALTGAAHAFTYSQVSAFVRGTETHSAGPSPLDGILFMGPAVSTTDGSGGVPAGLSTYSTMVWGNGLNAGVDPNLANAPSFTTLPGGGPHAGRSGLQIAGTAGTINVGDTVVLAEIAHRNQPITPPSLRHVDIFSILQIFDGADLLLEDVNVVPVDFLETPNNVTTCNPSTQISTVKCDDFATFPLSSFAGVTFSVDDVDYLLTFSTNCIADDPSLARCDIPDPNDPERGRIITAEAHLNRLQILMTLTQLTVPAPPGLLLMGLGLAAAVAAARRRS